LSHWPRVLALLLFTTALAIPSNAQTALDPVSVDLVDLVALDPQHALLLTLPASRAIGPDWIPEQRKPSGALKVLHASFGALETLDVYTTVRGINMGLTESNPLMRAVARHPVALGAIKAGATASTILLTRRLARHNRPAAIIMMAAFNTTYAAIAFHNLRARPGSNSP
jgi:hypothetical protein